MCSRYVILWLYPPIAIAQDLPCRYYFTYCTMIDSALPCNLQSRALIPMAKSGCGFDGDELKQNVLLIEVFPHGAMAMDRPYRNLPKADIRTGTGIHYRVTPSIQVEGALGILKNDFEFQRFPLRGKTKVKLEILLLYFGYNINKLHAKIQSERLKNYLFEARSA